jgi:hypothetical protein
LRFVLKILRGKCKDSKIHLLVAVYEQGKWVVRYIQRSDAHKEFVTDNQPMAHFASPHLLKTLSESYHEQTSCLYRAFDAMGGTGAGSHFGDFRVGRNYQLRHDLVQLLLTRAFPEEPESERGSVLHREDLISFTIMAPHQFDALSAKQELEHKKANPLCAIHPSEGIT